MGPPFERGEQERLLQGVRKIGQSALQVLGPALVVQARLRHGRVVAHRRRLGRFQTHDPAHDAANRPSAAPVAAFVQSDGAQPDIERPCRIISSHGEPGGRISFLKHVMRLGLVSDVATNKAIEVGLGGDHQRGEGGPVSARRANLDALPGPHARRLTGVVAQGLDDRFVEHLGLAGGQHGSHLEDMSDRGLLEVAHGGVKMIDRRLDLRRVAITGGDGGG